MPGADTTKFLEQTATMPEHGRSGPLGATLSPGGVNFSLYSRHASEVELLLFNHVDDM
ncbi:MAG TPA: hypothetical protein VFR08_03270, partial [Candidatus Angelobacter sp.]|nr:hypothetical protein [Candidatus Angelobacter sp.]